MLPLANPKDSVIALAINIFSGIITDVEHAPHLLSLHITEGNTRIGTSLVVDISSSIPLVEFRTTIDEFAQSLLSIFEQKQHTSGFPIDHTQMKPSLNCYSFDPILQEKRQRKY